MPYPKNVAPTKAAFFIALPLALCACGRDQNLYGHWEGDRDWRTLGQPSEEVARALAAINLDLKSDDSFVLTDGGVPFTGTWYQTGDGIALQVQTILNRPLEIQSENTKKAADFTVRYASGNLYFRSTADKVEIELKKKTKRG